jgi:peptide/nickel transport system substrate-binding protein/oligopeptide transport system substrate-binding protein
MKQMEESADSGEGYSASLPFAERFLGSLLLPGDVSMCPGRICTSPGADHHACACFIWELCTRNERKSPHATYISARKHYVWAHAPGCAAGAVVALSMFRKKECAMISHRFCPGCGMANERERQYCCACGQDLLSSPPQSAEVRDQARFPARYQLIATLGIGGFSVVYRARDLHQGREVAIKQINLQGLSAQETIEATDTFNREVSLLATLDHPQVPRLFDFFGDADHWYLVLEYLEGVTLETYLETCLARGRAILIDEALAIGLQLCAVLTCLHTHHPPVVFRDLKPGNIIRAPDGKLSLIDFGIARFLRPGQARDTRPLGSPGYAAPEQYGRAQTTPQTDIYSLGALLHALLSGQDPPCGDLALLHLGAEPAGSDLAALVQRMLSPSLQERPASVRDVANALEVLRRRRVEQQTPRLWQPPVPQELPTGLGQWQPVALQGKTRVPLQRRRFSRATLGLTLLLLIGSISLLAAHPWGIVRQSGRIPPPVKPFTYRIGVVGTDTAAFDPARATDANSLQAVQFLYTGLVQFDKALRVTPQLAQSWSISTDGLTYTFHLRLNLKFSEGTPLEASDVAYSLDRALSPELAKTNDAARMHLGLLKDAGLRLSGRIPTLIGRGIMVRDDSTIALTLSEPAAYFLAALAYPVAFVVERQVVTEGNAGWSASLAAGVGADGPFGGELAARGSTLLFSRNPNYYGQEPVMRALELAFFKTPELAYAAYQANLIDQTPLSPIVLAHVRPGTDDVQFFTGLAVNAVAMNYLYRPFDNVHMRQAFDLALDTELFAYTIEKNTIPASCHMVPPGPGYDADLTCLDHMTNGRERGDPERARTLFAQGLQEEGLTLKTLPPLSIAYDAGLPEVVETITLMRQMWQSVLGVKIGAQALASGHLLEAAARTRCTSLDLAQCQNRGLALWYTRWQVDYPDPHAWLTLRFAQGSPLNSENYGLSLCVCAPAQRAVQQLMAQADWEQDPERRQALYDRVQQLMVNDVAWLPISQQRDIYVKKLFVESQAYPNALGRVPSDDWSVSCRPLSCHASFSH